MAGVRTNGDVKFIKRFRSSTRPLEVTMIAPTALERILPQPQSRQAGLRPRAPRLVEPNHTDIVGDDAITAVVKPGREGRFAAARWPHEGHRLASDLDRVGV